MKGVRSAMTVSLQRPGLIGAIAVISIGWTSPGLAYNQSSVATITNAGTQPSSFCTKDGHISVDHGGWHDPASGSYAIGFTLLQGPSTYHLQPGPTVIAKGCYSHTLGDTTVIGNAGAQSTVWYNQ